MAVIIAFMFMAGIAMAVLFFFGYNQLQRISQLVKETASNIQVMLRKKLELTQQAMDVCKGYADHEKLVHLKVSGDMANSFKDLANANARAEQALAYVSQLASRFPDLKADVQFIKLNDQLERLGNQLQVKREQYNAHVRDYNTSRTTVPTVFVARALKFPEAPYLNFGDGGTLDVLQTFQTDDGARLEHFLGNLGQKVADGTKAAVDKAAEVGTAVAQKARTSSSAAVDFSKDRLGLKKYRYSEAGTVKGPVSRKELDALIHEKKLTTLVYVLEEGGKDWIKYEVLAAKDVPPPPPDASVPPPPDAVGKSPGIILMGVLSLSAGLLFSGCAATEYGHTSPYHPGPVAGQAVGDAAGVVAGNAAGLGVGAVEGAAKGFSAPFDPSYHMVRHWKTETTADGRVIQVPVDILVDKYGRPVDMPAPTGNSPVSSSPAPVHDK